MEDIECLPCGSWYSICILSSTFGRILMILCPDPDKLSSSTITILQHTYMYTDHTAFSSSYSIITSRCCILSLWVKLKNKNILKMLQITVTGSQKNDWFKKTGSQKNNKKKITWELALFVTKLIS